MTAGAGGGEIVRAERGVQRRAHAPTPRLRVHVQLLNETVRTFSLPQDYRENVVMTHIRPVATPLPLVAFTAQLVADLTGLSVSQLQRWDRNGFFQPWRADSNRRRPYSRIYSLPDVFALRAIAELRRAGASFAEVKRVRSMLVPDENGQWPVQSFHVVGKRIFVSRDEALAARGGKNQADEPVTVDLSEVTAFIEHGVRKLEERRPEEIGQVARNRWIMSGVPIIAGTRIPTQTIAWFHDNGYTLDWIVENFPRLMPEDVQAAIAFEKKPDSVNRELVLAQR
jgi:uncharacterized protein (DUF433 family)